MMWFSTTSYMTHIQLTNLRGFCTDIRKKAYNIKLMFAPT